MINEAAIVSHMVMIKIRVQMGGGWFYGDDKIVSVDVLRLINWMQVELNNHYNQLTICAIMAIVDKRRIMINPVVSTELDQCWLLMMSV